MRGETVIRAGQLAGVSSMAGRNERTGMTRADSSKEI
jgi:hypothetical protein